jgi:hypothetical protein
MITFACYDWILDVGVIVPVLSVIGWLEYMIFLPESGPRAILRDGIGCEDSYLPPILSMLKVVTLRVDLTKTLPSTRT